MAIKALNYIYKVTPISKFSQLNSNQNKERKNTTKTNTQPKEKKKKTYINNTYNSQGICNEYNIAHYDYKF